MRLKILITIVFVTFLAVATTAAQTTKRIKFAAGRSSATVKGSVSSYGYVDYLVTVGKDQVLTLELSGNSAAQMVIFEPSGDNMPDAAGIREMVSQIDEAGTYKVRVLQPRSSARRGKAKVNFSLFVKVVDMQ